MDIKKDDLPKIKCTSCGNTLFFGRLGEGKISIKCKCGVINNFHAEQTKKEGRGYQERLQLTTK